MIHMTPKCTEIANTERLLRLAGRYASTGIIHDELIPFFNQDGQWDLVLWGWPKSLYKVIRRLMQNAYLPEERRIERCPDGWRLRTSFVWWEDGPVQLPWAEVAGTVRILKTASVVAPKLRIVGSHVYVLVDHDTKHISAPYLRWVGGNFKTGEEILSVEVPSLEHVGGSIWVTHARSVAARRLKTVGGDLWTPNADAFRPRHIRIGGTWHISPVAEKQKIADERAAHVLRTDEAFPI